MKFSDTGTLSPDDIQARLGKLTASRMADAQSFLKNGKESAERRKLKFDLLAERLTGIFVPHHVTGAMLHGIESEPLAKQAYQDLTGRKIRPASFLDHPSLDGFGATPDGFVESGLIEIKCPTTPKFISWRLEGVVPDEHKPQMIAQCLVTQKDWVDFVAFDPRMPAGKQIMVLRYVPTSEEKDSVYSEAVVFLSELDAMFEKIAGQ